MEITTKQDITIKCTKCGTELSADLDTRRAILEVEPCETCLEKVRDEGYEEGFAEG